MLYLFILIYTVFVIAGAYTLYSGYSIICEKGLDVLGIFLIVGGIIITVSDIIFGVYCIK